MAISTCFASGPDSASLGSHVEFSFCMVHGYSGSRRLDVLHMGGEIERRTT